MQAKSYLSLLILIGLVFNTRTAIAQTYTPSNRTPIADNTLGTQVSGTGNNFNITGGLTRGQTLFHSFTDFSVPTSGAANFTNPVGNRDIITRVTGTNFSDINGLINSNGANFFLTNPNGITFGTNATLNVGRAFMASTANGLNLVDTGGRAITFGTNSSGDAPLLSIAPNVLFNVSGLTIGGSNGQINNFGTLQTTNSSQYIGLIGGNVNLNGGIIIAPGGRVELGGLSVPGTVPFGLQGDTQLPTNVARGDVSLTNGSRVDVIGAGGGDITISSRNLELLGSRLLGGIGAGLGTPTTVAGNIKINATDKITVNGSLIQNRVNTGAVGKGGGIEISVRNLFVTNGAVLNASTNGRGDAGTVKIIATENVSFDGGDAFSTVEQAGVGKAGGVEISVRNLSVTSGAQLQTVTRGQGDAGTIKITATENVSFDGRKDGFSSGARSNVELGGVGKGGGVEISARNLSVTNGARLTALTRAQGDAGTVKIIATENVSFDTQGIALSTVEQGGVGKAGGVDISARNISVTNGAQLQTVTRAQGDAGTVKITATENVFFDSQGAAYSSVERGAVGNAGGVEISTRNLAVNNVAGFSASTFGRGDAGTVKITAIENVSFDGRGAVFSTVEQGAVGKGGGVEISARNISFTNGGRLSAGTFGRGDAGKIEITATENVSFDGTKDGFGSAALSASGQGAIGKGGGVEISARNLSVTNGAVLSSSAAGGNAGNIVLKSDRIVLNQGRIRSTASTSTGGDITIIAKDFLILRNNSSIATNSASTGADGNGGNITIDSPAIVATPGNNDITANAVRGNGGRIKIASQGLFGIQFRPKGQESAFTNDITASSTFGRDGNVNIDTPGADPGRDSAELPNTTTDASNQISQACSADSRQNQLIVTGRGGLPPNAYDPLTSDVVWQDARATSSQPAATSATNTSTTLAPPAVGWVFDGKGKVTLIAAAIQGQPTGSQLRCPKIERSASGNK